MLIFVAVLWFLCVRGTLGNPEKEDRIYYTLYWREEIPVETANIEKHKIGETEYFFEEVAEKEELNHSPNTIDQINRMIELREKKLSHSDGTTKITLVPFGSIQLESEETKINIGKYHHTYKGKENIIQSYRNGDQCDICRSKRWKGTIIYKVDKGPLELTGPIESSTCNFTLMVKGKELGIPEKYKVLAVTKREEKKIEATQKGIEGKELVQKEVEVNKKEQEQEQTTTEKEQTTTPKGTSTNPTQPQTVHEQEQPTVEFKSNK